jgi:hypothetical protein
LRTDGASQVLEYDRIHSHSREPDALGVHRGHRCLEGGLTIEACAKHGDMLIDTGVIQFTNEIHGEEFGSSSLIRRDDMNDPQR